MAAITVTRSVACPMHADSSGPLSCGGEHVTLTMTANAGTFTVEPCTSLTAQGWTGPQLVDYMSRVDRLIPAETQTVLRHRDGLVTFNG